MSDNFHNKVNLSCIIFDYAQTKIIYNGLIVDYLSNMTYGSWKGVSC